MERKAKFIRVRSLVIGLIGSGYVYALLSTYNGNPATLCFFKNINAEKLAAESCVAKLFV